MTRQRPSVALAAFLACAPLAAQAPSEAQMQQMMEQARAMQDCMAGIDPQAMEDMQAAGERMETEIRGLCAAGKRDEAQRRAVALGREMAASPAMQEMSRCGEMARSMLPPGAARAQGAASGQPGHVCDGY